MVNFSFRNSKFLAKNEPVKVPPKKFNWDALGQQGMKDLGFVRDPFMKKG